MLYFFCWCVCVGALIRRFTWCVQRAARLTWERRWFILGCVFTPLYKHKFKNTKLREEIRLDERERERKFKHKRKLVRTGFEKLINSLDLIGANVDSWRFYFQTIKNVNKKEFLMFFRNLIWIWSTIENLLGCSICQTADYNNGLECVNKTFLLALFGGSQHHFHARASASVTTPTAVVYRSDLWVQFIFHVKFRYEK